MRKIDEVLDRLGTLKCLLHQIVNELAYKKANEKQSDMIRDLTAKNAVLERDNDLLVNALKLKGDTKCIMYKGRRYMIEDIAAYESQTQGEVDSVEMRCFAIE